MNVIATAINGLTIIEPTLYSDGRGYFMESFNQREFLSKVCKTVFVQDNESLSCYGVVRGLHFQAPPMAQSKLVRAVRGSILDVAIDIRYGSPSFGMAFCINLTEDNKRQLFIPKGFAHGFSVLSESALLHYKTDNFYSAEDECSIAWDDPQFNIEWGIPKHKILLSERDSAAPLFSQIESNFDYNQYKHPTL